MRYSLPRIPQSVLQFLATPLALDLTSKLPPTTGRIPKISLPSSFSARKLKISFSSPQTTDASKEKTFTREKKERNPNPTRDTGEGKIEGVLRGLGSDPNSRMLTELRCWGCWVQGEGSRAKLERVRDPLGWALGWAVPSILQLDLLVTGGPLKGLDSTGRFAFRWVPSSAVKAGVGQSSQEAVVSLRERCCVLEIGPWKQEGRKGNRVQGEIWEINLEVLGVKQIQLGKEKGQSRIMPHVEGRLEL